MTDNLTETWVKRPVQVEAVQLTKDNVDDVFLWVGAVVTTVDGRPKIKTLEGIMVPNWGDYIIKGIQGEFYPCKPDIFEASYDKV